MEGKNGETTRKSRSMAGRILFYENQAYEFEGTTLGAIHITRCIHGRCLIKLLKNTKDPSEEERLIHATQIERRPDLTCCFCHNYLDLEPRDVQMHEKAGCHRFGRSGEIIDSQKVTEERRIL
jgi:hypothetical protein